MCYVQDKCPAPLLSLQQDSLLKNRYLYYFIFYYFYYIFYFTEVGGPWGFHPWYHMVLSTTSQTPIFLLSQRSPNLFCPLFRTKSLSVPTGHSSRQTYSLTPACFSMSWDSVVSKYPFWKHSSMQLGGWLLRGFQRGNTLCCFEEIPTCLTQHCWNKGEWSHLVRNTKMLFWEESRLTQSLGCFSVASLAVSAIQFSFSLNVAFLPVSFSLFRVLGRAT